MRRRVNSFCSCAKVLVAVLVSGIAWGGVKAAVTVLGGQYQQDQLYPDYKCIWHYDCHADVVGGNVHVYVNHRSEKVETKLPGSGGWSGSLFNGLCLSEHRSACKSTRD